MNITLLVEVGVNAQFVRPRTHHGQRSLNRFLHDLTQRTGVGQLAFAWYAGGFDGQQIAPHLRPRQTGHLTDTVLAIGTAIVKALYAEIIMQILTVNLDVFQRLIQQQLFNGFTAQLGDFTLQATNPASRV